MLEEDDAVIAGCGERKQGESRGEKKSSLLSPAHQSLIGRSQPVKESQVMKCTESNSQRHESLALPSA